MTPRPPAALLRLLARVLIRGTEGPFVRTDLDDAFERDVRAGLSRTGAHRRYAVNVLASAANVLAARLRSLRPRFSLLDVRLGVRMLVKYPALTLVATFAMAIGIPVGLMPMHAVDALEAHLPEDPAGRLRLLRHWNVDTMTPAPTTISDAERWRASLSSFDLLSASRTRAVDLEVAGTRLQMPAADVTTGTFDMLGVAPLRGRTLRAEDEVAGAPNVVVINEEMTTPLGTRATDLVGTSIRIGGVPHDVIGVMPARFRFPSHQLLWLPLRERPGPAPREGRPVAIVGRLAPGLSPDDAQSELTTVQTTIAAESPDMYRHLRAEVVPTSFMAFGFPRGGLRALPEFGAVQALTLLPLLIACVNVGLLTFARTTTRASEFTMRTALGASRGRILSQVFTESFVLALLATGLGLVLLYTLPERVVTAFRFIPMPYWLTPDVSTATVFRALGLACVCAVVAGVIPAIRTTTGHVQRGLQRAAAPRAGTRFGLTSSAMIVTDVAVAVVACGVAIGLGSRVNATMANEQTDGIRADRYLSVAVTTPDVVKRDALVDRLRREPGVGGVAIATTLPRMDHPMRVVEVEGQDLPAGGGHRVRVAAVAPGFFEALGAPILAGRTLDGRDAAGAPATVIANTTFVANILGGQNAVGRRVRYRAESPGGPASPWMEIVGVVGHLGMRSLAPDRDEGLYLPLAPDTASSVRLAIEAEGNPLALAPRVQDLARAIDPAIVVAAPTTLDRAFEGDWYVMTAAVGGATLLVGVLLALAVCGLYAIMSFTISERTREIGIRMALGADRRRIVVQVARRAVVQIAVGIVAGLPFAAGIFFEMQESSPSPSALVAVGLALAQGVTMLVLVALAACYVPARRALRISPVEALRGDG